MLPTEAAGHKGGSEPRAPGHGSGSRGKANLVSRRRTRESRVSAVSSVFPRTLGGELIIREFNCLTGGERLCAFFFFFLSTLMCIIERPTLY